MVGSSSNKGKYGKARRGGGRQCVACQRACRQLSHGSFTSFRELSGKDKEEEGMWGQEGPDESSDEEESEEEVEEPQGKPKLDENGEFIRDKLGNLVLEDPEPRVELSRQERKALKAASKGKGVTIQEPQDEEDEDLEKVDNSTKKAVKVKDLAAAAPAQPLSRREREEKAKKEAKARYQKLTEEGKTDQAKADLARLRKIREERERAAAVKKAEAEERAKVQQANLAESGRRKVAR